MNLFRMETPKGMVIVPATDFNQAKVKTWNWLQTNFPKESPAGGWQPKHVKEHPESLQIGTKQIRIGDYFFTGFHELGGKVTDANIQAVKDGILGDNPITLMGNNGQEEVSASNPLGGADIQDVDPVAGFLKGIGFDFGSGRGAARDYQQQQAAYAPSTFFASEIADYAQGIPSQLEMVDWAKQTGIGGLGKSALGSLQTLAGLGNVKGMAGEGFDAFVNPLKADDVSAQNVANLLNQALRGAGISRMFAPGPSRFDVADMFTRFAGSQPNIAQGEVDQNFLQYAADQTGLSRFFDI